MTLAPGTRLGPYEVVRLIGAGGMGEVYAARDVRLDRTVAIKILPPELSADPVRRARFAREARTISQLSHPNICPLFDVGELALPGQETGPSHAARVDYLVMEYLVGETLLTHLRKAPLPLTEAVEVASQVAKGLGAAHRHGIVHRDLKPSNVMLTKTGVKILDFGIAQSPAPLPTDDVDAVRTTAPLTGPGTVLGTRPYMAPEQLEGKPTDARTDLWALGAILYEMLAGRPAFAAGSAAALTAAILEREPEPLGLARPDLPPALDRIVRRCLAKDPDSRWDSANDLADELAWVGQTSGTGTAPVAVPARRKGDRWKRWPGRPAIVVVLVLAGAVVAWRLAVGPGERPGGASARGDTVPASISLVQRPRQLTSSIGWEAAPAISPDGSLVAYVSNAGGSADIWIAGVTGTVPLQLTNDAAMEDRPCWYPDGRSLAFQSDRSGEPAIWRTPVLGGSQVLLVPNAKEPAIDPAGERIAFARVGSGEGTRIAVARFDDLRKITVLTHDDDGLWDHRDPAWSPDGKTIAYAAQRGLWTVPAAGGEARRLTTDDEPDEDPFWSRDGRHVYFTSYREGTLALWRVPASGRAPERVTLGTGPESHPGLSSDGHNIVYTTFNNNPDVVIRELATGVEAALSNVRSEYIPSFSPDGRTLVFMSDRYGGEFRVWLQPIAEGQPSGVARVLTDHAGSHPAFSPDGRFVAYYKVGGGQPRAIWIIPADGGAPIRLADSPAESYHPAWSPLGTQIAFISEQDGWCRVMTLPVENGRPVGPEQPLTSVKGHYSAPAWSPDGSTVAYVAMDDVGDVWTVRADGTLPPRRVTSGAGALRVRWHPREGSLLVSTVGADGVSLWRVNAGGGSLKPLAPPVHFGRNPGLVDFGISTDGRWVTFARESPTGDIWLAEINGAR